VLAVAAVAAEGRQRGHHKHLLADQVVAGVTLRLLLRTLQHYPQQCMGLLVMAVTEVRLVLTRDKQVLQHGLAHQTRLALGL
jgi:hypothetical protein